MNNDWKFFKVKENSEHEEGWYLWSDEDEMEIRGTGYVNLELGRVSAWDGRV